MEKIKIIELLNRIANGKEVPKKIKTPSGIVLIYDEDIKNYFGETTELFSSYVSQDLNIEVEILEEDKKIEKIEQWVDVKSWVGNDLKKGLEEQSEFNKNIYYKINEIIDYLNKEK